MAIQFIDIEKNTIRTPKSRLSGDSYARSCQLHPSCCLFHGRDPGSQRQHKGNRNRTCRCPGDQNEMDRKSDDENSDRIKIKPYAAATYLSRTFLRMRSIPGHHHPIPIETATTISMLSNWPDVMLSTDWQDMQTGLRRK